MGQLHRTTAVLLALIAAAITTACAPLPRGPHETSAAPGHGLLGAETAAPPEAVVAAKGWLLWRVDADGTTRELTLCFTAIRMAPASASAVAPTCDGVPVTGDAPAAWNPTLADDWRWDRYAVAGRWDGEAFTPTSVVPMALYDEADIRPVAGPDLGHGTDAAPWRAEPPTVAELDRIAELLPERLGDAFLFVREPRDASLLVHVVWDDGTLQHAADVEFGDGVVTIVSALRRLE